MEVENRASKGQERYPLGKIPGFAVLVSSDGSWMESNSHGLDFTPTDWETFVHPEDLSGFWIQWKNGVESCLPFSFLVRSRGEIGQFLSFSASPHFVQGGGSLAWLCIGKALDHPLQQAAQEQASETNLRLLADHLPQMVWSAHANGEFDFCNKRWLEFTGLPQEEFQQNGWRSVLHPEDLEQCLTEWAAAVSTGSPYCGERRFRSADGSYRWFLGKASPIKNSFGKVIKWFGTCTDIHEQKENFRLAQEATSYLQNVIDHAEVSIWSTDDKGVLRFFEGKGLRTRNVVRENFLGKNVWEMHLERPEILRMLRTAWEGYPSSGEIFYEGKWLESHITPLFHDTGSFKGVVGVTLDITALKSATEKARKAEQQLLTVIHSASISLWSISKDGFCIFSEGKGQHKPKLLKDGSADSGWENLERDLPECVEFMKRALGGESLSAITFSSRLGRWHEVHYSPVFGEDNQIVAMVGVSTDVTDRKEAERLAISEHTSKEASRLKTEFFANISHEIRTPMNSMVANTEFLSETLLSPEQSGYVQSIQASIQHLLSLVNEILDLSKIEAGKMTVEKVPYNIFSLLGGVVQELETSAHKKGIRLSYEISPSVPLLVKGDPTRVRQILLNLLSNAVKFTNHGGIVLRLSCERDILFFEVEDTGIGMDKNVLSSIFMPFVQGDASTVRKFGGSGLGLSICKRLVELMGGEMGVESEINRGTKFWFRLPLISAELPVALPAGAKILVAEDNPANQKVVTLLLQKLGMEPTLVQDGSEVIEILQRESFDLVLMDCQMPKLDGFATAQIVREKLGLSLPIIAVTAHAIPEIRERCMMAGMNDFLAKPITRDALLGALGVWLRRDSSPAENPLDIFRELDPENPKKLLAEMLALYRKNTVDKIHLLGDAVARKDFTFLEKESHRIKSPSCYLGGKKLGDLCQRMESLASAESAQEMESLFSQIYQEVHELDKRVGAILQ